MHRNPTQPHARSPLPSLRVPRTLCGDDGLQAPQEGSFGTPGSGSAKPAFGTAWSPPASLNGTLVGSVGGSDGVAPERYFTLSSSQRPDPPLSDRRLGATPPKTARVGATYRRSMSPCAKPQNGSTPPVRRTVSPIADRDCQAAAAPSQATGYSARVVVMHDDDDYDDDDERRPPDASRDGGASHLERSNATASKAERIADVERFMSRQAASYVAEPQRNRQMRRAVEDMTRIYPALAPALRQVSRYIKDIGASQLNADAARADAMQVREKELRETYEAFFEKKISEILIDKKKLERTCEQLHQENLLLRQERDEDLMEVKVDLLKRLNECEKREDEFRSFRQLIAAVFKTNEQLTCRIEDLEFLLNKHRIEIPPATEELYRYSGHSGAHGGGGSGGSGGGEAGAGSVVGSPNNANGRQRRLEEAAAKNILPPAFMRASKEEMNMARLTLQQELLHCAFDDRSAYRLQLTGMKNENNDLKYQVSLLTKTVEQLNRYIHEKRFLTTSYDEDGNTVVPLTPRPRDVPFGIETELGIDLKAPTGQIVSELAAVGTNLKHQLNSALLRLRQATAVSEWMDEETLIEIDDIHSGGAGVLPTFPMGTWPTIPHFLRTLVGPDVDNMRWSPADTGAILLTFFRRFKKLRSTARYVRDSKMVVPRVYQQFERRDVVLTRLDATKEEVQRSEDNVPFGYIVSHFIRTTLMSVGSGSQEAALLLPGTLQPRFTVRGEQKVVELEHARFAYNLWWAVQRHRLSQPLCRLFLDVVNGRLPIEAFEWTERVLEGTVRYVQDKLDVDGSRCFTYNRLVGGVTKLVADMGAQATRCGVLAVAQTFEENQVPVIGGRVRLGALTADESCCVMEPHLGHDGAGGNAAAAARSAGSMTTGALPPTITARRVPGWQLQPLGASVFVRYWRRLVLEKYEQVYSFVEQAVAPLVIESDVVLGLFVLPVPEALARCTRLDESDDDAVLGGSSGAQAALLFPSDSAVEMFAAAEAGAEADAGGASGAARAMPDATKNYAALLEHRRSLVMSRRRADRVMLAKVVEELVDELPRLNRSVHFPFGAADATHGSRTTSAASPLLPPGSDEAAKAGSGGAATPAAPTTSKTGGADAAPKRKGDRGKKAAKGAAKGAAAAPEKDVGKTGAAAAVVPAARKSVSQAAGAGATRSGGRSGGSHRKGKSSPEAIVTAETPAMPDEELVEWFGFCAALRKRAVPLPEYIFSSEFSQADYKTTRGSQGTSGGGPEDLRSWSSDDKPFADGYDSANGGADKDDLTSGPVDGAASSQAATTATTIAAEHDGPATAPQSAVGDS